MAFHRAHHGIAGAMAAVLLFLLPPTAGDAWVVAGSDRRSPRNGSCRRITAICPPDYRS